jgi:hypothetical protein
MLMEIIRVAKNEYGVFGVALLDHKAFCVTLEPMDLRNAQDISCIPLGTYTCMRKLSPHFGDTFEVTNVPGRANILIHPGNSRSDTHGCILLARKFGVLGKDRAILNSGDTFKEFLDYTKALHEFSLCISEYSGVL